MHPIKKVERIFRQILRGRVMNRCMRRVPVLGVLPGRSMIFAPHPDDETLAAGGFIALKKKLGDEVRVVFLTRGEASHRGCCSAAFGHIAQNRTAHACNALNILGLDKSCLHWLNLGDGHIPRQDAPEFSKAVASILEILNEYQPQQVFCTHAMDFWPDHQRTEAIIHTAVASYVRPCDLYHYLVWGWCRTPLSLVPRLGWESAFRIDISSVFKQKKEAVQAYLSQKAELCGKPFTGHMPGSLMKMSKMQFEVFFKQNMDKSTDGNTREQNSLDLNTYAAAGRNGDAHASIGSMPGPWRL